MKNINQPFLSQPPVNLSALLASISDTDLDLLISANSKMQRGETVLTRRELDACIRWQPHLDSGLLVAEPVG